MIQFDWMHFWNKSMYFDTETSKVYAVVDYELSRSLGEKPVYAYEQEIYLELKGLQAVIERKFSRWGTVKTETKGG